MIILYDCMSMCSPITMCSGMCPRSMCPRSMRPPSACVLSAYVLSVCVECVFAACVLAVCGVTVVLSQHVSSQHMCRVLSTCVIACDPIRTYVFSVCVLSSLCDLACVLPVCVLSVCVSSQHVFSICAGAPVPCHLFRKCVIARITNQIQA